MKECSTQDGEIDNWTAQRPVHPNKGVNNDILINIKHLLNRSERFRRSDESGFL